MFARIKTPNFIDMLSFELVEPIRASVRAILRDEKGAECSRMETPASFDNTTVTWKGLDELPYGIYTLELSQEGRDDMKMRCVKRV